MHANFPKVVRIDVLSPRAKSGENRITIPKNPIISPINLFLSKTSLVLKKKARGKTNKGILAIANPAKLDVTYCCPQLISWKGSAVLMIPIIPNLVQAVSLVIKSLPPRISQIMEVITVANTILAEVSQRGVIP